MMVTINVSVMTGDTSRLSQVSSVVADVVEKALADVPYTTELMTVTVEREST